MKMKVAVLSLAFSSNLIAGVIAGSAHNRKPAGQSIHMFCRNPAAQNNRGQDGNDYQSTSFSGADTAAVVHVPRGTSKIVAPAIFGCFSAALISLLYTMKDLSLRMSFGAKALNFVLRAVAWDNLIICIGSLFFSDAITNQTKYRVLKVLSYPRFIFHAVGVPFLLVTTAEIGEAAGISWLQNDLLQKLILVVSAAVAVISRVRFMKSPGIDLGSADDSPPDALKRDLTWFTYRETSFLYVVPSLVVSLFNLIVGVAGLNSAASHDAGIWLIVSVVGVIAGNAMPSHIMRFTGNLGEVVMLACMVMAASLVLEK